MCPILTAISLYEIVFDFTYYPRKKSKTQTILFMLLDLYLPTKLLGFKPGFLRILATLEAKTAKISLLDLFIYMKKFNQVKKPGQKR